MKKAEEGEVPVGGAGAALANSKPLTLPHEGEGRGKGAVGAEGETKVKSDCGKSEDDTDVLMPVWLLWVFSLMLLLVFDVLMRISAGACCIAA